MMFDDKFSINYAGLSDVGLQRSENQDSYGIFTDQNILTADNWYLFILADGMGGHERGKEASTLAVNTIKDFYCQTNLPIPLSLQRALEKANQIIYNRAHENEKLVRMGTTCDTLLIAGHSAYIAHVGDSRVYRINIDSIEQLTSDHSQVAEMVRKGILSEEEAKNHPSKSVLSRALGVQSKVEVDILQIEKLQDGHTFLLCSDGLSKVNKNDVKEVVNSLAPDAACHELVRLANQSGGQDNVTVQVVRIEKKRPPKPENSDSDGNIITRLFKGPF